MKNNKELIEELEKIDASKFQRLGDKILRYYNVDYKNLTFKGNHIFKNKTVKGTPDSFKWLNNKIIAIQYTTSESDLKKKMFDDLKKVSNWENSKYVSKIVLVSNSRSKDVIMKECKEKCESLGWEIDFVWLDTLLEIIEGNFNARVVVKDILKINYTEVSTTEDFKDYYKPFYKENIDSALQQSYKRKLLTINKDLFHVNITSQDSKYTISYDDFTQYSPCILIGEGGSGKSIIMEKIFLNYVNQDTYSVFIDLSTYNGEKLTELIKKNIEFEGYQVSIELIDELLNKGLFNIFLDGLDEVMKVDLTELLNGLKDRRYKENKFFISSREVEQVDNLDYYKKFYTKPLASKTIFSALHSLLNNHEKDMLKQLLVSAKIKLFSNPMNLVMLIKLIEKESFDNVFHIVKNMDNDYSFIHYMVSNMFKWNRRHIQELEIGSTLYSLIPIIAYKMSANYKIYIDETEFNELINDGIKELGGNLDYVGTIRIRKLITKCGLLLKRGKYYRFEHKNFQDYFIAEYILKKDSLTEDSSLFDNLLLEDALVMVSKTNFRFIEENLYYFSNRTLNKILSQRDNINFTISIKRIFNDWFNNEPNEYLDKKINTIFKFYYNKEEFIKFVSDKFQRVECPPTKKCSEILENHHQLKFLLTEFRSQLANYSIPVYDYLLESNKYGKINTIFSVYALAPTFSVNHKFDRQKNTEERVYFKKNEDYFISLLTEKDEEVIHHILICLKEYCKKEVFGGIVGMKFGNIDKVYEHILKVPDDLEGETKEHLVEIKRSMEKKDFFKEIHSLSVRIERYNIEKDYYLAQELGDFFFDKSTFIFTKYFLENFGARIINRIFIEGLEKNSVTDEMKCQILRHLNKYDEDYVLDIISEMLCYGSDFITGKDIREESLMVLCNKISEKKVNFLLTLYNNNSDNALRLFLLLGIWSVHKYYGSDLNESIVSNLELSIQSYKKNIQSPINMEKFANIIVEMWDVNILIKDMEKGLNTAIRIRELCYFVIKDIHEDLLEDLFKCIVYLKEELKQQSFDDGRTNNNEIFKQERQIDDVLIWLIQRYGIEKRHWIKVIEADPVLFKKNINKIQSYWSDQLR
ncbi:NACHT domain-containing protein [Priestia megaterium]|uniref:NACHT domain-containing protein n=1 Tax=Priestia megaterium TaxID=1404 RepID=UPI0035B5A8D7